MAATGATTRKTASGSELINSVKQKLTPEQRQWIDGLDEEDRQDLIDILRDEGIESVAEKWELIESQIKFWRGE